MGTFDCGLRIPENRIAGPRLHGLTVTGPKISLYPSLCVGRRNLLGGAEAPQSGIRNPQFKAR